MGTGRIAVLGGGKMGASLVRAFLRRGTFAPEDIHVTYSHREKAEEIRTSLGVESSTDNRVASAGCEVILLAVKPQVMPRVLREIAPVLHAGQLVVSLAAASPLAWIEGHFSEPIPVVRAMPNLPCQIGHGMTVLCPGRHVSEGQLRSLTALFSQVGRVAVTDNQDLMDGVTALSGSGPAYGYIIIESLAEGGVKVGLPRALATTLAAQAMLGAAAMVLETGEHPAKLKDMVTTPAGTTVDGIMALEEGSLRVALIKAVDAATHKAREIAVGIRNHLGAS